MESWSVLLIFGGVQLVFIRQRTRSKQNSAKNGRDCPVCMEALCDKLAPQSATPPCPQYTVSTSCGHPIHLRCLQKAWLSGHRKCPVCRSSLPEDFDKFSGADLHQQLQIRTLEADKKELQTVVTVCRTQLAERTQAVMNVTAV